MMQKTRGPPNLNGLKVVITVQKGNKEEGQQMASMDRADGRRGDNPCLAKEGEKKSPAVPLMKNTIKN